MTTLPVTDRAPHGFSISHGDGGSCTPAAVIARSCAATPVHENPHPHHVVITPHVDSKPNDYMFPPVVKDPKMLRERDDRTLQGILDGRIYSMVYQFPDVIARNERGPINLNRETYEMDYSVLIGEPKPPPPPKPVLNIQQRFGRFFAADGEKRGHMFRKWSSRRYEAFQLFMGDIKESDVKNERAWKHRKAAWRREKRRAKSKSKEDKKARVLAAREGKKYVPGAVDSHEVKPIQAWYDLIERDKKAQALAERRQKRIRAGLNPNEEERVEQPALGRSEPVREEAHQNGNARHAKGIAIASGPALASRSASADGSPFANEPNLADHPAFANGYILRPRFPSSPPTSDENTRSGTPIPPLDVTVPPLDVVSTLAEQVRKSLYVSSSSSPNLANGLGPNGNTFTVPRRDKNAMVAPRRSMGDLVDRIAEEHQDDVDPVHVGKSVRLGA